MTARGNKTGQQTITIEGWLIWDFKFQVCSNLKLEISIDQMPWILNFYQLYH